MGLKSPKKENTGGTKHEYRQTCLNKLSLTDYKYYLHEPGEENHLLMSIYPYEVEIIYMDVDNDNGMGGGDIVYSKEIVRKIPSVGGCQEMTMAAYVGCIKGKLKEALVANSSKIKCIVPSLEYTDFDYSGLEYCDSKNESLEVDGLIYETAQQTHTENLCGTLCNRTIYHSKYNYLSKRVLGKELKEYGDGYYIIWAFYSSLYVNKKIETYLFDFNSTLVAIGGSLGLFLGWSMYSLIMGAIEWIHSICVKKEILNPIQK